MIEFVVKLGENAKELPKENLLLLGVIFGTQEEHLHQQTILS
jgi:hypothetical protein